MPETKEFTIKSLTGQINSFFLEGMSNRMDVSCFKYGDYRTNYKGQYTEEFLKDVAKHLHALVQKWKSKGTSANGNAIMFILERLLLYVAGGQTKGGHVPRGNTEYLIDASNGSQIEFTCPQVPGAKFEATDDNKSPGFSGFSEQEIKDFKTEHSED